LFTSAPSDERWTGGRGAGHSGAMQSKPTIRAASLADETELSELDRRNWSSLYAVHEPPASPYVPFFDATHLPGHHLVAELDELGIAGFIRVVPPTSLASNAHVRQIQGLVVDEGARRRGLARALLEGACELARKEGAIRLTLRVLGHNAPARRLYAAAGFVVEGVLPAEFLLDGQYVDDVLMGRWLAPRPEPAERLTG
jgi:GNAT superfamily N-acetyltransferase